MLRKTVALGVGSEESAVLARLGAECRAAGLSDRDTESVVAAVREPLRALIQAGRAVASAGGRLHASREVEAGGAAVTLVARYGGRPGLFARLRAVMSRRR